MKTTLHRMTAALFAAGLLAASALPATAFQSFNVTNVIGSAVSITSWPTNSVTTNYLSNSSFGTVTNGTTITTNGYYLGLLTGNGIDVNNYDHVGFVFQGLTTSSNAAIISFALVRGYGAGNGTQPVMTGNYGLSGWETTPSAIINVPVAAGTNVQTTWSTNLEVYYTMPADQIGVYSVTNNLSLAGGGWVSNLVAGLHKKIVPIKYP